MQVRNPWACLLTAFFTVASSTRIKAINGNRFLSPLAGQSVSDVTGVVTVKGPSGIWMQDLKPSCDKRVSHGIYVYGSALATNTSIVPGDVITIKGKVSEYRSASYPDYIPLTEIESPVVTAILEHGHVATPLVIGKDTFSPPTQQYTSLDNGNVFGVPNNQSRITVVNPVLQPDKYGLDFWESLCGQLVTIKNPRVISKPNRGDTWVVGDWATTGANSRGGLSITQADGNPEAIVIASPLDKTSNPSTSKVGDTLADITGVVTQLYGFYTVQPLTKVTVIASQSDAPAPATLTSSGDCHGLTVGSYNVENFTPSGTSHVNKVADHVVNYMNSPDLIFVQEIQDNDGNKDDGVVDSSLTLATLANAIQAKGGPSYSSVTINPVDDQDGGEPGGNIRVAYLYKSSILSLTSGSSPGGSTDANAVLVDGSGKPYLKYNPGRIDPANIAWNSSRKPLVAEWQTPDGSTFFTVNVHWASKSGSTNLHGDARPPVNGVVDARDQQAQVTGRFIAQILAADPNAYVITAGDFNEYQYVQPIIDFKTASGLRDMDEVAGIPVNERYSYVYSMNCQELDHMFVSPALAQTSPIPQFQHVHVNTWVSASAQVSDHDPGVALFNMCKA